MDDEQPRKRARLPTPKGGGSSDIPKSTNYEVSYLHRSAVARAACSARHGYVLTGSEDGAFRALEALVEDARRTCESRDARIASLLLDPPPALPAREPPDRLEGLQQQVLELQAVLQEKEASVQALRLRATFTQPEEARLDSRRLLQESVRLQLELRAKRAQRDSRSARDADVQRLERLRGMHSALQEEQARSEAGRTEAAHTPAAWVTLAAIMVLRSVALAPSRLPSTKRIRPPRISGRRP